MIFKNLFKAKWQHADANIRITAIKELNPQNAEDKVILDKLVLDDDNDLVRRTALLQINDFDTFVSQASCNPSDKIQKFCVQQAQNLILNTSTVSKAQKQQFLDSKFASPILEQWLHIEHESEILQSLLAKINKPNLLLQFILATDNEDLQLQALERIEEQSQLEKIIKKLSNTKVQDKAQHKLAQMIDAIERPKKVHKHVQLLLAKLLALKEHQDFADMLQRKQDIESQWQQNVAEFDCISEQEQSTYKEKYAHISAQLDAHFAEREQAYVVQQQEQQALELQHSQLQEFSQAINSVSQLISDAVFENAQLNQDEVSHQLDDYLDKVSKSTVKDNDKQRLFKQIELLHNKLNQLPMVAESVARATSLISKLSNVALPSNTEELNERKPMYDEWLKSWQPINDLAHDVLPQSITAARDEINANWAAAIKPLVAKQHQHFDFVRKKISELKRLIASGKYKSAFGLHTKLTYQIKELSPSQQHRIEKDFQTVSERIKELHELEYFVVTPRKQELLNEVQQLVESPLDSPLQQADKVKEFRKHWNALGHADEDVEQELNEAFNQACEQAFAPCREYFSQQSKLREQHLAQKKQLLQDLVQLAEQAKQEDSDIKAIDAKLHKLSQLWRQAGEVDRKVYNEL
ncbi:DUF349 domain-containing protein [Thalassotalea sp. HSM 43]|uniref:DUF349 domain-containing protein n=1 Tax=Thalassotalea sp. HSM 43 TaxID=2552945 RepID=UPI0010800C0C|nr:DUF349 domain-containing protein [Thalassotalea sp. HSM 43]QBY06049.1 DUF349 domain-containing protein [Thalassotalea sp. HSM 43]